MEKNTTPAPADVWAKQSACAPFQQECLRLTNIICSISNWASSASCAAIARLCVRTAKQMFDSNAMESDSLLLASSEWNGPICPITSYVASQFRPGGNTKCGRNKRLSATNYGSRRCSARLHIRIEWHSQMKPFLINRIYSHFLILYANEFFIRPAPCAHRTDGPPSNVLFASMAFSAFNKLLIRFFLCSHPICSYITGITCRR